ncbi:hypothetical protein KP78_29330 [Jeotgalibacillus soli]|uniref:Uncharacterized protein n=1 Tax=Jeotgalibacillus soli TaxID=889306 RepID=A0A0C2RUH0_9BACL|nr:hypothetical protein KP78_29330 [Jeotgalibacillus soli]
MFFKKIDSNNLFYKVMKEFYKSKKKVVIFSIRLNKSQLILYKNEK